MLAADDGLPAVGQSRDMLGVVPGKPGGDIPVRDGQVAPGTGGMSVFDSVVAMPPTRRSSALSGGASHHPTWRILAGVIPRSLQVRQSGRNRSHHEIEPAAVCLLAEYEAALESTRGAWEPETGDAA